MQSSRCGLTRWSAAIFKLSSSVQYATQYYLRAVNLRLSMMSRHSLLQLATAHATVQDQQTRGFQALHARDIEHLRFLRSGRARVLSCGVRNGVASSGTVPNISMYKKSCRLLPPTLSDPLHPSVSKP